MPDGRSGRVGAGDVAIVSVPSEMRRTCRASTQAVTLAFAPSSLSRRAVVEPSVATTQASLVVPFVASTRETTLNATHLPSREMFGIADGLDAIVVLDRQRHAASDSER